MQKRSGMVELAILIPAFLLVSVGALLYEYKDEVMSYIGSLRYDASPLKETSPFSHFVATHVATPTPVKAVYMTECVASEQALRERVVDLVNKTEINAIVIDIKDYSGKVAFPSENPFLKVAESRDCLVKDLREFIDTLHKNGIYVIGRITVFQDPLMTSIHPELAVKYESDHTKVWKDRKGISYIDPGAQEMWNYIVALSREAYALGFDELNFDYIRFPSDGNMADIYFPWSEAVVESDPTGGKSAVLSEFFAYLNRELKKNRITISADLFGMTTTNTDDLNIGQVLEDALAHFDYVSPMVYPSHYPPGFLGMENPAEKPYEVVHYSMTEAVKRASTTPLKLRPWLQDFNLGAVYTPEMVRAQMKAVYDAGLTSWMLWNAANRYTRAALDPVVDPQ